VKESIVYKELLSLLDAIHNSDPDHAMFGSVDGQNIRAPYIVMRKLKAGGVVECSLACSWRKMILKVSKLALKAGINTKEKMIQNCWMTSQSQSRLSREVDDKKFQKTFYWTRFLALLKNPSIYEKINIQSHNTEGGRVSFPFDHACQRGFQSEEQFGMGCINGLYHGELTTESENYARKMCKQGARVLCPGHVAPDGSKRMRCIYTNVDGTPRKCRMSETHVPICSCKPKCY
jgi:hypothetical protein